jgi:AcrR family transcriptional regulator
MSAQKSKERILLAAVAEFADRGYAGARVGRIAESASANKQLIYYYFGSKDGLYGAVLEHITARWAPQDVGATRGPDQVRQELAATLDRIARAPDEARLILRSLMGADADPRPVAIVADFRRRVAQAVSRGQGTGYFRDDVDPDEYARTAAALVIGDALLGAASGDENPSGEPIAELVLRGLAW